MDISKIKSEIISAIQELFDKDPYLLINDINERAISHKIGVYINNSFDGYDVDCEYNGYANADNNRKFIMILRGKLEELKQLKDSDPDSDLIKRTVYPDIIVHKRGDNQENNNLLAIEIKKSTNQTGESFDREKIQRYTSSEDDNELNYSFGAFMKLVTGSSELACYIDWYINGEIIESGTIQEPQ